MSTVIQISINCGHERESLTNVSTAATTLTAKAKLLLYELIEKLLKQGINEIDGVSNLQNQRTAASLALAQIMLDVYDVFIEHLWAIDNVAFGVR